MDPDSLLEVLLDRRETCETLHLAVCIHVAKLYGNPGDAAHILRFEMVEDEASGAELLVEGLDTMSFCKARNVVSVMLNRLTVEEELTGTDEVGDPRFGDVDDHRG